MLSRSSRPDPVVLISQVRDDASFQVIERQLEQMGYQALLSHGSAFEHLTAEALGVVDTIWVVHTLDHDPASVNSDIDAAARSLGRDRVGIMVENSVPVNAEREGFRRVHFSTGEADVAGPQLATGLKSMGLAGQPGIRRRLEATQNSRLATGLAAPLLMLLAILGVALVAVLALLAGRFGQVSDDADLVADRSITTDDDSSSNGAEADPGVVEGEGTAGSDPAGAAATDPFAPVDQAPVIGGIAAGQMPSGSNVDIDTGGSALGLGVPGEPPDSGSLEPRPGGAPVPDTCVLDLRKDTLLADPTVCTYGGELELEGPVGPWHNDLGQIILSDGVVGILRYENTANDVVLSAGIHQLELPRAAYGIDALQLTFTGEGQHVHFVQTPERGEAELTVTFAFGRRS